MPKIGQLPFELISLILKHVDRNDLYECTLINKLFYKELIPVLWRRLDIDSDDRLRSILNTMATSPRTLGEHVRSVFVTFSLTDCSLLSLTQHIPFVQELRLYAGQAISDTGFAQVPRHCPQLTTIGLHYAFDLTHVSISAIGQHGAQLSTIEFVLCPSLDADLVFDALAACPLQKITILRCHLNHKKDPHLFENTALALHRYQQLTCLQIQDITDDHTPFITTANTHQLVWPYLTHLTLDACDDLDDTMLTVFLQAHPQLCILELGNSDRTTDHTLDAILMYLPDIKHINLQGHRQLTATGIYRLVTQCSTLEKGIGCAGCGISPLDSDFPKDLDPRFYRLGIDLETQGTEVVWMAPQYNLMHHGLLGNHR